ncbi:MAG: PDZ domain-containing protein [Firmicutes bacterium]|nr:PDZ domain-containing protein [Bacillota bacterium]
MPKKALRLLVVILLLVFGAALPVQAGAGSTPDLSLLEEIHNYIIGNHVDNPDEGSLIQGAIEGMLDALNDPYTTYLPPQSLENFRGSINGDYAGIGVSLDGSGPYPKVDTVFETSPAMRAGLKAGDLIVKVDGVDVAGTPLGRVTEKIRGPEGTTVVLVIRREGRDDFEVAVKRANINIPTAETKVLEDGTGYIRILSFGSHTPGEFEDGLKSLRDKKVTSLIIDLRDCPGGLLSTAVDIAGNFVAPGKAVTSVIDRDGKTETYRAAGDAAGKDMRIAVLVNHNSASASEILAGALQDYGLAVLVGGPTYGKGSVQSVIPLKSGGALKLTTARYHTAKNRAIDGKGLKPDIQVLSPGLELFAAQRYLHPMPGIALVYERSGNTMLLNGGRVKISQTPLVLEGRRYLPLRLTLEALGFQVDWRERDGSIKIGGEGMDVIYYPQEGRVTAGAAEVSGGPLIEMNGVFYLPADDLKFFGASLREDENGACIEK